MVHGVWSAPNIWLVVKTNDRTNVARIHVGPLGGVSPVRLPTIDGVSVSAMTLPFFKTHQKPLSLLYFLEQTMHIPKGQSWIFRMNHGLVLNADGGPLAPDTPYQDGQKIYYYRHMPEEPHVPFDEKILYQDDHLLVADKPHFLPVSPTGRYVQETLLVRLKRLTGLDDLTPIHRIDRDTAGLVLMSVQRSTRNAYAQMFRQRAIRKTYEAIAPYRPDVLMPLVHRSRLGPGITFMQMSEIPGEANSETHIDLIERLGSMARYRLQPITGKRHQLRVHMCALGMPIWGDQIYPNLLAEPALEALNYSQPLQLLAKSLDFPDPVSGLLRSFTSLLELSGP